MKGFRMTADLPPPLHAYFEASNAHDADLLASLFTAGATVRDEGREMQGPAAIRAWAEETFRKYDVTTRPQGVGQAGDAVLVTAEVSGTFRGSPIRLTFRFRLADGKIDTLEIG
jgi:ketosteroid isomerase-like protein